MSDTDTGGHLPDTNRVIEEYRRAAHKQLLKDPFRQILRITRRRLRELHAHSAPTLDEMPPAVSRTVAVPAFLRAPSLNYSGFRGPWFEEYFYHTHRQRMLTGAAYVPIFWDNFFAHAQCQAYLPSEFAARFRAIWRLLATLATSDQAYFTIQGIYEFPIWNWHRFPRNVLVLAADGYGDVPIPLLKGDRPLQRQPKDILISFMGRLETHQIRRETHRVFGDIARFGMGADWEAVMARSHFSLCPRGGGPTSFRLFEALSVASIPIYIWDRWRWLPYEDELDWSQFGFVVEAAGMAEAKAAIQRMPPTEIRRMQDRIEDIYSTYFSYDGVARWIGRRMNTITCRADAEALSSRRAEFKF